MCPMPCPQGPTSGVQRAPGRQPRTTSWNSGSSGCSGPCMIGHATKTRFVSARAGPTHRNPRLEVPAQTMQPSVCRFICHVRAIGGGYVVGDGGPERHVEAQRQHPRDLKTRGTFIPFFDCSWLNSRCSSFANSLNGLFNLVSGSCTCLVKPPKVRMGNIFFLNRSKVCSSTQILCALYVVAVEWHGMN